jgi:hypothetical protein
LPYIAILSSPAEGSFAAPYAHISKGGFLEKVPCAPPVAVIADLDILCAAPAENFAAAFGLINSKLLAVFDAYFSAVMRGTPYCNGIAELIFAAAEDCMAHADGVIRRERRALEAVVENIIRISLIKQLMPAATILADGGAEKFFADFISKTHGEPPRLYGENSFLGARVLAGLYKAVLKFGRADILPPPDMSARAEKYAELTGLPEHEVLSCYKGVPDYSDYAVTAHKYSEYRRDFYDKISRLEAHISRAGKVFKRIYPDAGYRHKNYLMENDYRAAIALSPDVHGQYTFLTFMRDRGYLERFLSG